ncbi:glycine dehydrogenase [Hesseltinella vesiculosa]|uniref:Glycine cleavage system H protein n=1 Tax=Hesseltinella vesiculosa TaxID=101127 RepID=A0A1X2GJI8_9FUNG|nr:glycine dehydrogenase [Hesseltinella vesiculosa]
MSLAILSARIVRSSAPLTQAASFSAFRTYATKKYTAEHEWVSVEGGVGTIGITDFAQKALGDVVFVESPAVGDEVGKDEQIGAVESVKAASDILSPVSGEVVDVNEVLSSEPTLINSNPEDDGWIAKIKLSDEAELESLMDEATYKAHCDAEEH